MPVFLSTDDGRILLANLDQRRHYEMADFKMSLVDIALTKSGGLLGTDGRLVYQLDIATGRRITIALISSADIVGIDADNAERAIIGTASGQIWRQERDGSLTDIGIFGGGIQGMARMGGYAYAATNSGAIAVMNLLDGSVTELIAHGLGEIIAISVQDRMVRLTAAQASSQPQFFTFDPATLDLVHEAGLLGFYDTITGSAYGDIGTVTFQGGGGDEEFIGTAQMDVLIGGEGDDRLYARDGNDTPHGGPGDDLLSGEAGEDWIEGGAGDDKINGGNGLDWVVFSSAAATVDLLLTGPQRTGDGIDQIVGVENLRGSDFADVLKGSNIDNVLEGGQSGDTLWGRAGDDTLRGQGGNDVLDGGEGDDVLNGGSGFDIADYSGGAGVQVQLSYLHRQDTSGAGTDKLRGLEGLWGSENNDTLGGNHEANSLRGGGGHDDIQGGAGTDTLNGDAGHDFLHGGGDGDQLFGGAGNDTLVGGLGAGSDTSTGGDGADVFVFVVIANTGDSEERLVITDFDAAEGDRIDLVGLSSGSFERWSMVEQNDGADTLVRFQNDTEIQLLGVSAASIQPDWFF